MILDTIIHRLKTINPWHFVWITILLSEVCGLLFNAIQSYLWWGFLSNDLLLIGAIDGLFVPLLVAPIAIYFVHNASQLERINKELQLEIIKAQQSSEQKTRESEALYRVLFENATVGIGIADISGTLIAFNDAMLAPGGYTREDMATIGNVSELYYTIEERNAALAIARQQGFLHQFPVRFKRREGTPYDTLLSLRFITYQGRPCVQAMVEDITERKRAEKSLMESREQFRKLVETMNEGLGIQDEKGVITYVNERFCQMVGYSSDELLGKELYGLLDAQNRKILEEHIANRQKGDKTPYDLRWTKKNGEFIYTVVSPQPLFDETGRYIGSFATLTDITTRKQLEKSLKESEERFRLALENSPIVVFNQDRDLRFTWIYNPRHGYLKEQVIGKTDSDLFEIENIARLTEIKRRVIETGLSVRQEVKIEVEGEMVYYDSIFEPLYNPVGSIIGLTCVAIDITKRKQDEELIRSYKEQLSLLTSRLTLVEEAERRKIAVELHDNIGQILACAKLKLGEISEAFSGEVRNDAKQIYDLIEQSIRYTRSLTFELCPPILYEMGLEAAVEWLGQEMQKNYGIAFSLRDDRKPKPLHEEVRVILFQSVRELLNNVIRHSKARRVTVSIKRTDHSIEITVEDDGTGFDASRINNGSYMTCGFGLFSVHERVKNIGGHLGIHSKPGSPTQITLTAPLKSDGE